MEIAASLRRLCLAHADVVLVPAEALSASGLDRDFGDLLVEEGRVSEAQSQCLSAGFALYYKRCADLFRRAPLAWFPARATNVLVAAEPRGLLPYVEPFKETSSLLYVSDLDTDPEYVAYLLLHMERLGLMHSVRAAIICNLSYWFDRSADERTAFARAAAKAQRPDAAGFLALAKALRWIDELLHDPLRPPKRQPEEPFIDVNQTGLFIPKRLQSKLVNLCDAAESAAHRAMQPTAPAVAGTCPRALDELIGWLEGGRARAIVVGPDKSIVWNPDAADISALRSALADVDPAAVASIHADLRVIDQRSREFLACVRNVESLPRRCAVLESGGGIYVDAERRAIAYELVQPGFDPRSWVAPPYHRLLVGARVVHEWGHVAHAAKMIAVPPERKPAYTEARAALGDCFARTLGRVPARLRSNVDHETAFLASGTGDVAKGLARKTLARVGDYLSNMLCARLLPAEEMQAYVRTNVTHHLEEGLSVVSALARYAYEVHYLGLAGISRDYFFSTSRFPDYFIASGIVSEDDANALFDAVGAVLAHYEFDESLLSLPERALH
jgi:hypothetical protein